MAKLQDSIAFISVCLLSIAHLYMCFPNQQQPDFHDLLPKYGFPKGLFPKEIKSYSLSDDGSFTVKVGVNFCHVTFKGEPVYFDDVIKGKIGNGIIENVSGITIPQPHLLLTLSVNKIKVHAQDLEFYVGYLSRISYSAEAFEKVHSCFDSVDFL